MGDPALPEDYRIHGQRVLDLAKRDPHRRLGAVIHLRVWALLSWALVHAVRPKILGLR